MNGDHALPRVLCVDDEPNLLRAMERTLKNAYEVTSATSGALGLERMRADGPFDVVISDMRMPEMNGVAFLSGAREIAPDSVRILLTGHTDVESAMAAVNQGAIFRFLAKPCAQELLRDTVRQAVEVRRVAQAERALLETTLTGSVRVLCDVLALAVPSAHRRAVFARGCTQFALTRLGWDEAWLYELAASLSQLGYVGVPADIMRRAERGRTLSVAEQRFFIDHAETARILLTRIPRLERVAAIVRHQNEDVAEDQPLEVRRGARLIQAALRLYDLARQGLYGDTAATQLHLECPSIPAEIIAAVTGFREAPSLMQTARVDDLMPGWIADEPVLADDGRELIPAGHEFTETTILTLQRLAARGAVAEPLYVRY